VNVDVVVIVDVVVVDRVVVDVVFVDVLQTLQLHHWTVRRQ
jgi:hypothetical protein